MKPKVALVKDGFLPAGSENARGRMSAAAIARCKELVAQGWTIDGYSRTDAPAQSSAPKVEKVKPADTGVVDVREPTRDETALRATTYFDGETVKVGMRTACNNCRSSLNYCHCPRPVVWIDHENEGIVKFHPVTK